MIVEVYARLGESFLKSVEATVSTLQMKLIQVYIEKSQKKMKRNATKTPTTTPRRGGMRI